MVLADEHRVASQVRHRVPAAWAAPALGVVLEDEHVVSQHDEPPTVRRQPRAGAGGVPPHLVQVTAEEEDILDACELGRGVVGRRVDGGGVERVAGALGHHQGFNDGPPSLSLGNVEHVHVSQQGDAVDLAVVGVVGQVDELVPLPNGDVEDHPLHVPCLDVGQPTQVADSNGDIVIRLGVWREHDLWHRLVVVPQREERDLLAAGEMAHEVDPRGQAAGGAAAGVDGQPTVAGADDTEAAMTTSKRGEGEQSVRRKEQGEHLREVPVEGRSTGWWDGDGDERRDWRREGGAPRRADAAGATVEF